MFKNLKIGRNLKGRFLKIFGNYFIFLAPITAFLFGLSLLFSVISAGDGTWFLYAKEALSSKGIYSDLGLTAQPIFPLVNMVSIYIFGDLFISQKLIFVLILGFYVHSLYLLVNLINANIIFKSIVYFALFFIGIHFEAFRFDDYHALANALFMYCIYVGYSFLHKYDNKYFLAFSILASLTFLTRINQGLAVITSFGLLIIFADIKLIPKLKIIFFTIILSLIVFLLVMFLANESPITWFYSTLYNASSAKGGGNVFFYPLKLFANSFNYLRDNILVGNYWYFGILYFCLIFPFFYRIKNKIFYSLLGFLFLYFIYKINSVYDIIIETTPAIAIFVSSLLLYLCLRSFFPLRDRHSSKYLQLLFFPVFLFAFSSFSSGGFFYGLYFESSISILILLIIYKNRIIYNYFILFIYFIFSAFSGFLFRFNNPYSWHSYHVQPLLLKNYLPVDSTYFGPHLITRDLSDHINPVCSIISKSKGLLLSLPFSFANYYCDVPVWKGYVQTFFDTSTSSVIDKLIEDISHDPPNFIFYQRQVDSLRGHEIIFNQGNPLPHRRLDSFIMDRIDSGAWKVIYRSSYAPPSDWLLINTLKKN